MIHMPARQRAEVRHEAGKADGAFLRTTCTLHQGSLTNKFQLCEPPSPFFLLAILVWFTNSSIAFRFLVPG
eukprot:m.187278 g.187278  ORF g.187278 m.187278 type:complete len:71 (-) comp32297_c0_seq2:98-310(-)